MGWSDSIDEKFEELEKKLSFLAHTVSPALVGKRVRLGSNYRWVDGERVFRHAEYGVVESGGDWCLIKVRTESGELREDDFFNILEIQN